jgi:hypothetical protein
MNIKHQGEGHNRAISLDRLNFNPDGTIQMVKETKVSIAPSAPSRKRSQARWGCPVMIRLPRLHPGNFADYFSKDLQSTETIAKK